jgi:hypothetical protein
MKRVTGIGGIFFNAEDAPSLQASYKRHLAIDVKSWGRGKVFDFFNVFVDNSTWHWLGLYEDAATAHTGYFDNAYVGEIIACGVNGGSVGHACDSKAW